MADKVKDSEDKVAEAGRALEPTAPQKGATVGDEAVNDVDHPSEVEVNVGTTTAQVVAERDPDSDKVIVSEVRMTLDKVITDPSDPLAVQIPDAGVGSLSLPIHSLAGKTPEDVFAAEAGETTEVTDEHRKQAAAEGRTAGDVARKSKKS